MQFGRCPELQFAEQSELPSDRERLGYDRSGK
jgi:hypothetical protein